MMTHNHIERDGSSCDRGSPTGNAGRFNNPFQKKGRNRKMKPVVLKPLQKATVTAEECAVCFGITEDHVVPCKHRVCRHCFSRWAVPECPVCRRPAYMSPPHVSRGVSHDVHFEQRESQRPINEHYVHLVPVRDGLLITWIHDCHALRRAGLSAHDVITHMNGIAVMECQIAYGMLDRAWHSSTSLVVHRRRRPLWWCLFAAPVPK